MLNDFTLNARQGRPIDLAGFCAIRKHVFAPRVIAVAALRHVESLTLEFFAGPAGDRLTQFAMRQPEGRKNDNTWPEKKCINSNPLNSQPTKQLEL